MDLRGEHHADGRAVLALQPLEERDAEAQRRRRLRLDHGRQLLVVTRQHGAPAAQQRHPTRGLERLCGLIDDDEVEGVPLR